MINLQMHPKIGQFRSSLLKSSLYMQSAIILSSIVFTLVVVVVLELEERNISKTPVLLVLNVGYLKQILCCTI